MKPLPTLRQLRYLTALADHLHFGQAAKACFVTQSTLSTGLQELESILGVGLVERTSRHVMLTTHGVDAVARARSILRAAEDLVDEAAATQELLSSSLKLGVIPTICPYLLPRSLPDLRAQHPDLKLYLREDLSANLVQQLHAGQLDLILLALPYDADDLETIVIAQDDFWVALPPGHPLAKKTEITGDDLQDQPLLLLEDGHCLREHALAACRFTSVKGQGFQATSLHTLVQMVANGLGVTLLPALALRAGIADGTGIVTRPLAGNTAFRQIGLGWRRTSPHAATFLQLADFFRAQIRAMM